MLVIISLLCTLVLASSAFAVFPSALLERACLFLSVYPRHYSGPAILAVEKVIDLLSEVLPRQLTILGSRAGLLTFYNDTGREVFELDG